MIKKIKKNALVISLGTMSAIYFCVMLVKGIAPSEWGNDYYGYIIWIYYFVSFVSWLNCYESTTHKKRIFVFDLIIQLSLFGMTNFLLLYSIQLICLYFVYIIIILLILLEVFLHVFLPFENEKEEKRQNKLQENEIFAVVLDELLSPFNIRKGKYANQLNNRVKISVMNAVSFFVIALAYGFKYVLDIINMWKERYCFPMSIICLYIAFMLVFIYLEIIKSRLLKYSLFKTTVIITGCIIGIYMFVFMQFGYVRIRVMICSMYMVSPYLFNFFKIVKTIQLEEHKV